MTRNEKLQALKDSMGANNFYDWIEDYVRENLPCELNDPDYCTIVDDTVYEAEEKLIELALI